MRTPTAAEVTGFFLGLEYAEMIAQSTKKGHIAAGAIRREYSTLSLYREQQKPLEPQPEIDQCIDDTPSK